MTRRSSLSTFIIIYFALAVVLFDFSVWAASPQQLQMMTNQEKAASPEETDTVVLPEKLDSESVDSIIASMSDEQVRRLLIQELKKQAALGETERKSDKEVGGFTGFIEKMKNNVGLIQDRIKILQSADRAALDDLPGLFTFLGKGEDEEKPDAFKTILGIALLFAVSLAITWSFGWFIGASYRRVEKSSSQSLKARIGGLALKALFDFFSICFLTVATLALFFIFMDRNTPQRILVATYLSAFLIVMIVRLLSRFFLTPKAGNLRFLPMDDENALFLHRWIMAIAIVGSFGWLTCGIFRIAGTSEAAHLMMVAAVGLVVIFMQIIMILQKREAVRQSLGKNLPDIGIRAQIARSWHRLAISALILLWLFWALNLLLAGVRPGAPGVKTLIIIPVYFLLDWALKEVLRVAFGIAAKPADVKNALMVIGAGENHNATTSEADIELPAVETDVEEKPEMVSGESEEAVQAKQPAVSPIYFSRAKRVIQSGSRVALAAFFIFYLMGIWGIEIQIGKTIARAGFNILIAVLICYVAWELVSAAIQKRLKQEIPDDEDEEKEEGGAGGSRIATLLVLLRKFMLSVLVVMATLIILSSIGVEIGPLIAGAGVIGLAIGFGAQTLVKDIISGVFFLIDDAFRVGDYVDTGVAKGMVQHISLRSLKLRNPRGMVHTIPFGDIGTVTNFSRDYIITKLDIRLRYDTDLEMVRKIIKKEVYMKIMQNEELAPKLLDPIKSQGVRQMEDSAMIVRVKYKTIPGEQFVIRKEVYRLMQEAFKRHGIEFAHRNVTVYMPSHETESASPEEGAQGAVSSEANDKKKAEAAAAAAIAAAQAEEEAQKPKA
jgi:small-conductance mechanosensitive channel